MNAVDIHPEELLDKLMSRTLTSAERKRLDVHLSACEVCRFELALRGDVERDVLAAGAGGAERAAPELAAGSPDASSAPLALRTRSRLRRWAMAWAAALALFVLAAVSLASYATRGAWPWVFDGGTGKAAPAATNAKRALPKHDKPAPKAAEPPPPMAETAPIAVGTAAPAAAARAPLGDRLAGASSPVQAKSPGSPVEPNAAALFAAANEARRAGDVPRALELYRKLRRRFPAAQEASLSHVIVGRLLLGMDAAGALSEFDAYLATGASALAAEAWVGRARSLAALGRHGESRASWREVLIRYPRSVYADEARTTLGHSGSP
jgi:TolA-binding protein